MRKTLVIVNPRSANGKVGRQWPSIEGVLREKLGSFDAVFTDGPNRATALTREALDRYELIAVLGGDGSVNEVVNGFIEDDRLLRPDVAFGVIPCGTGADFVRTLGIPRDFAGAAERLVNGTEREVDIGKVVYRRPDGSEGVRYFVNEAEIGMGGAVCEEVNRSSKRWGGRLSFLRAILVTMVRYPNQEIELSLDGAPAERVIINNVWLANGKYSGGGICCAPRARLDDGLLDIVLIKGGSLIKRFLGIPALRSGAFARTADVVYRTAKLVEATSEALVPVETEGEPIGTLPARFEILGDRLRVIA
jgi:YegS/Rv2252/BmrU family lipid kinase